MLPQVSRAGEWFLGSGIQSSDGGVARYYLLDPARNQAVSTEITGYTASAYAWLYAVTVDQRYLDRARVTAHYLCKAYDAASRSMPFELQPAAFTYFFDCGIIVRGLLAVWRATREAELLETANKIAESMARDFGAAEGEFYPILQLPGKQPLERDPLRWSRSPGCYQLKAGMAWFDLAEITGDQRYQVLYESLLQASLRNYSEFLPGHAEDRKVVDRLHAFLYFLEGLLPVLDRPECVRALRDGMDSTGRSLQQFAPLFERTDVFAQLLRIRIFADRAGIAPLDSAAQWESDRLQEFSAVSEDVRVDGGFYFGRSAGVWEPYINPVSTAFAAQALALWHGPETPERHLLI